MIKYLKKFQKYCDDHIQEVLDNPILIIIIIYVFTLTPVYLINNIIIYFYKIYENKKIIKLIEDSVKNKRLLEFDTNFKFKSMGEFFAFNNIYDTSVASSQYTNKQCFKKKRRSLGDIYRIYKYYYPQITIKEIIEKLQLEIDQNKLSVSYCNDIKKCVFTINSRFVDLKCKTEYKDYTWEQIVNAFKNKK
jgi:hypothetical protein